MSDVSNLLGVAQQLLGQQQQAGHGPNHDGFLQDLAQRLGNGHTPIQGGVTYQVDEKFFSPTHDFWIKDAQGQKIFQVDDKLFSLNGAIALKDASGRECYSVTEKILTMRDVRFIQRGGERIAQVHKALFSPLVYKFTVTFNNGAELHVAGNITDHQYAITYGQQEVAHISRQWSLFSEHYGVTIIPGQDDALLLTISACVEAMVLDD
ncbi:LURP-one-related family protein [Actinoallomurus sp. NPDC050550]|uniref:LURP-one-related/scramblase family protein n=1 Tax=Actinoallomurus sp. NPDC050550 TaxID=3154937 RepID=UPI0033FEFA97